MTDNVSITPGSGAVIRTLDQGLGTEKQVVALDFGGESGPESLVTLSNPYPIAQTQTNFFFSTGNSSTTQLAAGATFTGTVDSVINQNALSQLIESDQPFTFVVNQYIGNTDTVASSSDSYTSNPTTGGYGLSKAINLNGNYVQILVTNTGVHATTKLNINTYYGTIPQTAQVIGTFNQVTGQIDTLENGDNANDFDLPNNVNPTIPSSNLTGLLGAEAYPRMFDGITWQRQRGQIDQGLRTYDTAVIELMTQVLTELRLHTVLMQQVYAISDDMNSLRNDVSITQQ